MNPRATFLNLSSEDRTQLALKMMRRYGPHMVRSFRFSMPKRDLFHVVVYQKSFGEEKNLLDHIFSFRI